MSIPKLFSDPSIWMKRLPSATTEEDSRRAENKTGEQIFWSHLSLSTISTSRINDMQQFKREDTAEILGSAAYQAKLLKISPHYLGFRLCFPC